MTGTRRWVVKIDSALLTTDGRGLDRNAIAVWVKQIVAPYCADIELVLASSSAVAAGMGRLSWVFRPSVMHELQAAASVRQMGLVQAWEFSFALHGLQAAQVLLTHDDLSDREHCLNARDTLRALVGLSVIPMINENDTVITDETRFGDNDTLAALVTSLVEANLLIVLTDRNGMFDTNPRNNPGAQLIYEARADDPQLDVVTGGSAGVLGRGGIQTKLRAAHLVACSSGHTVIVGGRIEHVLSRLRAGERLGTLLTPGRSRKAARKQWLAGHSQMHGTLVLDDGAVRAISQDHKSLLPVGVKTIQDDFHRGEIVVYVDQGGREVTRGLINYSALKAQKTLGQPANVIKALLGYVDGPELARRDNLVLV